MGWMHLLCRTYDIVSRQGAFSEAEHPLIPVGFVQKSAGLCVTLDSTGAFAGAVRLVKGENDSVCIPTTAAAEGRALYVTATAYSAQDPGNSAYTASGTLVRHGVIAVDPSVIPLGARVFIPGYGEAVAEDIGWGIQGYMIDVAFDTHEEALMFGRQNIDIYLLE